jgi:formiminoglutamase
MAEDQNWPRASAWLGGAAKSPLVGVLGIPLNCSITPGRADLAPRAIRAALHRYSTYDLENEIELGEYGTADFGDLPVSDLTPEESFAPITRGVAQAVHDAEAVVLLGGDNGVTRPALRGLPFGLSQIGLITLDAHLDLRDCDEGLHNGNPIRALLNDGLPGRSIVQIGIQSFANSSAYSAVARQAGIRVITAESVRREGLASAFETELNLLASRVDVVYLDLDLDVMDRAFAPGTPGSRPGGFAPWELRQCAHIAGRHPKVRLMDLVELDPDKDINDATSLAAAACLLSFASGVARRVY